MHKNSPEQESVNKQNEICQPEVRAALQEKGFDDAWIDALARQNSPRWYRGEELNFIGLTVGGQYAGQVYLSGDGQLWYWDIFNRRFLDTGGPGDKFYNQPMQPADYSSLCVGFMLEVEDKAILMDGRGFTDVAFRGEYPIGRVQFKDKELPLDVELEAFSPFCPTDSKISSMPATIMNYRISNTSDKTVSFSLGGWLENATNRDAIKTGELKPATTNIENISGVLLGVKPDANSNTLKPAPDSGSMALALLNNKASSHKPNSIPASWKATLNAADIKLPKSTGVLRSSTIELKRDETAELRFAICWHFPEVQLSELIPDIIERHDSQRHHYSKYYKDAKEVALNLAENHERLTATTRLWRDTWYDSTLPTWFLDRTFINTSSLATTVAVRLTDANKPSYDGRVYFAEGVYLGDGTCTHVTHYEQAFGRLFPEAARAQRAITDYNIGWDDELGYTKYRAESVAGNHFGIPHAIDGHAGTILRTWREHTMSTDDSFLTEVWPRVKRATQFMIDQDAGRGFFEKHLPEATRNKMPNGIIEGPQYNTLDKVWDGLIPWISSLYLAALQAASKMAREMGDDEFARTCEKITELGRVNIAKELFDADYGYFVQHPNDTQQYVNSNRGSHIDQVIGDYWTHQAGLPQVLPRDKTRSALGKIFEHNFHRHIGEYRKNAKIKCGRFYCDDDEPGTLICAFPHGGEMDTIPSVKNSWDTLVVGYFSECMTGFTYQLAAHMISEGLVCEGLALCRAIHERYAEAPERRNPFNEVEYGNHYTRAMASYAAFIAICGFEYHGPKGIIGFAPKLNSDDFRACFTTATGWGTFTQKHTNDGIDTSIALAWGELSLNEIHLNCASAKKVLVNKREVEFIQNESSVEIKLPEKLNLKEGDKIVIELR